MTVRTVSEFMTRDVVAVSPETALDTVAATLTRHRISGAPVVDATGKAVGVISLADIVNPDREGTTSKGFPIVYYIEHGMATPSIEGADFRDGRAEDVMTPLPFTIESSATIVEASAVMVEQRIHRLLVVEGGALVGIVSTLDLLRGFVEDEAPPSTS